MGRHPRESGDPSPGYAAGLPIDVEEQIEPIRIVALDQFDLPRATPSLDRLLTGYRFIDRAMALDMDQPVDAVFLAELASGASRCCIIRAAILAQTPV